MPYVTNAIAIGMVFAVMFSGDGGIVNRVIELFGGTPINWLGGKILSKTLPNYTNEMIVLLVYIVWHSLPFKILILLSGLQGIDKQYYQAAQIDSASRFTILTRITVPFLSPQIAFLTTTSFIGAFKEYSDAVALFGVNLNSAGMNTIVGYVYDMLYGESGGYPSYASAAAIILFFIVLSITIINLSISKKKVFH